MSSYENFARVYDLFMDNIPYEEWCAYLTGLLKEYNIEAVSYTHLEVYKRQDLYGILHAAGTDGHGTYAYPCDRE